MADRNGKIARKTVTDPFVDIFFATFDAKTTGNYFGMFCKFFTGVLGPVS